MNKVNIHTTIPGPFSKIALAKQLEQESSAVSYPKRIQISLEKGNGCYVQDIDGNVFIDFLSGAGSLPLGHSHPELIAEVNAQVSKLCLGLDFPTPAKELFTEAHLSMLPESLRNKYKIHFCGPTGADAIEAAIKLAKIATGADEIISFRGGYHGCTHAAIAVTGNRSMKKNILGKMPGVHFFPYGSESQSSESWVLNSDHLDAGLYLESALNDANSGLGNIAAIILELIQGEGGVYSAQKSFVDSIIRVSKTYSIPVIIDEIQTGCGRTGTWYAFEQYGIEPDIFVTSKGTSGIGLPSSLMFYKKDFNNWTSGIHIGTFRGNQLAFASGTKAIEIIKRDNLLENVKQRSIQIKKHLAALKNNFNIIGEIRGKGLMLGVEILNASTGKACEITAKHIQKIALNKGLITELGGRNDTVLRILPPLNVSSDTIEEAIEILRNTFRAYMNEFQLLEEGV
ncbi:diaminobutyrate--2-oxoglutarate transaminase family protein [Photorhabdus laumondii subsp. laumondii]|uniref:Diaminobutyrate--2-oxoglutarate transaminase family protein n=1 Tax=Photorhabdus laumondii subsp. laumondii TaxID=141679 RepID=A0A6L9JNY4_PHOLM|nr:MULTISPECIES: diaminobutyrate--2-oxoglutarate transaminase family protein [Photorhabdus]AWK43828.1 diaminobutyrate--2-oxoglutarate transaminase [Photorhabdus laumondii subsp. laumondii]AXG44505.1 diaminobutyrate--2-oxoglutarate transaminase [Photorhabdus laumondii subsp. laumondii]MCC8384441.1 diaminobutyrate--2-oxoglutarate transaminase family protein [Photorhabdus laumondii]MCC8386784.1 diaminobutyrate--2-oxoglutarate transaminase family protein [Photorhabdus laumondii]MCC8413077.1 diamin